VRSNVDQERLIRFGKQLAGVRKSLGITQEELSHKSGLSLSQIARIETGAINTTLNTIFIISDALEIKVVELFNRDND
tara:strand:+ start:98060 stop:98293 length:234 start_codon:yes stop_codon:yes gene_type:complete